MSAERTRRRLLAGTFLFGSIGTAAELVLLEHTEGLWQNVPLVLLGIGCAAFLVVAFGSGGRAIRIFQTAMALFVASGVVGVWLHYRGNVEFELELHPGTGGLGLFWEALGGATPALAPGAMILLGAVGVAYTYRVNEVEV